MDKDNVRYNAASAVVKLAQRKYDSAISRPGKDAVQGEDVAQTMHNPLLVREAIEYFRIALEINKDRTILNWKGIAEEMLGDFDAAILSYQTLLDFRIEDETSTPTTAQTNNTYGDLASAALNRLAEKKAGTYDRGVKITGKISKIVEMFPKSPSMTDDEKSLLAGAYSAVQDALLNQSFGARGRSTPAPLDAEAAANLAGEFGKRISENDFHGAHELLSQSLQKLLTTSELERTIFEMLQGETIEQVGVISTMHDWLNMQADDVLWAYISIECLGFNEAATVIVARQEKGLAIRDIEWGRP